MVYGIFTAGQRTWGGPRADAGQADAHTTMQAAIEHAEATGDDLNVIPATFRPALEASIPNAAAIPAQVPLQPSAAFENRFRSSLWYHAACEAEFNHQLSRSFTVPHIQIHTSSPTESLTSLSSTAHYARLPRRAETMHTTAENRTSQQTRSFPPTASKAFFDRHRESAGLSDSTQHVVGRGWNLSVIDTRYKRADDTRDDQFMIPLNKMSSLRKNPRQTQSSVIGSLAVSEEERSPPHNSFDRGALDNDDNDDNMSEISISPMVELSDPLAREHAEESVRLADGGGITSRGRHGSV